ncbi:MAG TPA: response regulator transcription factor [Candidatus Solibacter sp.]|nr:response regulator transcription factor [Candidatus Solibacter sp.]
MPAGSRRTPASGEGGAPENPADQVRVLIVDDHEVVRQGIRSLLEADAGIRVVGEADGVKTAISQAKWLRPQVVVMDVRLTDGSGITATREIRNQQPDTRVLMLTSYADQDALFASIMAGASGYVLKQIKGIDLVSAVLTVGRGQSLLDPSMTQGVLDRLMKSQNLLKDEKLSRLTAQEERILNLLAEGKTNRQIGEAIHLAEKTVKNYVSTILSKLEVARRAEAAAYVARHQATPGDY